MPRVIGSCCSARVAAPPAAVLGAACRRREHSGPVSRLRERRACLRPLSSCRRIVFSCASALAVAACRRPSPQRCRCRAASLPPAATVPQSRRRAARRSTRHAACEQPASALKPLQSGCGAKWPPEAGIPRHLAGSLPSGLLGLSAGILAWLRVEGVEGAAGGSGPCLSAPAFHSPFGAIQPSCGSKGPPEAGASARLTVRNLLPTGLPFSAWMT